MPISERLLHQIEYWQNKLIDLSKRNRLLFYKRPKHASLKILQPSPQNILDKLLEEETLKIWQFPPEKDKAKGIKEDTFLNLEGPGEAEQVQENSEEAKRTLKDFLEEKPLKENEILADKASEENLLKALVQLHRKFSEEFLEKGASVLYVSFGFLEWKEQANTPKVLSPIILCPVRISRKNATEAYNIELGDDEIVINPALNEKLKRDFKFELPELPEQNEKLDLEQYFNNLRSQVKSLGWEISEAAEIGLFSFHKIAMFNELKNRKEKIGEHPLIALLGGEGTVDSFISESETTVEDLEDIVDAGQLLHVLDADSSQQICIEEARKGKTFIIKGPPGTGKSQTITNIICEFIESGKTVLFVSEKMAALEVVFKRLKSVGVDSFCMELHSHKANKAEVVEELVRTLSQRASPSTKKIDENIDRLLELKENLKKYVVALHQKRSPIELSIYEIISALIQLEDVPYIPCGMQDVEQNLTLAKLKHLESTFAKLKYSWNVAKQGENYLWFGCAANESSAEKCATIKELLENLAISLSKGVDFQKNIQEAFKQDLLPSPSHANGIFKLLKILKKKVTPVPVAWLEQADLNRLLRAAEQEQANLENFKRFSGAISHIYNKNVLAINPGLYDEINSLCAQASEMLGKDLFEGVAIGKLSEVKIFCSSSGKKISQWCETAFNILNLLGMECENTSIQKLKDLLAATLPNFFKGPVAKIWEKEDDLQFVDKFVIKYAVDFPKHGQQKETIRSKYSDGIYSLDLENLVKDFGGGGRFRKLSRFFNPRFYQTLSSIKKVAGTKSTSKKKSIGDDLVMAFEVVRFEKELERDENEIRNILGDLYQGSNTDFQLVKKSLDDSQKIKGILNELHLSNSGNLECLAEFLSSQENKDKLFELNSDIRSWELDFNTHSLILPIDKIPGQNTTLRHVPVRFAIEWFLGAAKLLTRLEEKLKTVSCQRLTEHDASVTEYLADLEKIKKIITFKEDLRSKTEEYRQLFGEIFNDTDTDWEKIICALDWTKEAVALIATQKLSDKSKAVIAGNVKMDIKDDEFDEWKNKNEILLKEARALFDGRKIYSFEDSFQEILILVDALKLNMDGLKDWVEYSQLVSEINALECSSLFQKAQEVVTDPSELSMVVRKSMLQTLLDRFINGEPVLKRFTAERHEDVRAEYQALDKRLNDLSRNLIIAGANKHHPGGAYGAGAQMGVLRREQAKKRGKKSLRKLFGEIPELAMSLKRCFLMSPLSVTHYLDPDLYHFDLVVFDEASQIFPEDTISAISRGSQVIVVGDRKQLPPTSFFQDMDATELTEDEESEIIEDLPSILDTCWALGLRSHLLKWHYRSKHEHLITFSNRQFYGNQLVTFPSKFSEREDLGVKFIYVEDGIYERGERRINIKEAERVADFVIETFEKYPKKSIGVVALSISQRDAIENVIEIRLKNTQFYERLTQKDRLGGFFIKNLETVQGDERDVIVISVGYGKDKSGNFGKNFGPINKGEGWRRLNVLITRAKERCVVISSIRASNFNVANLTNDSLKHFHKFLDYAERGLAALAVTNIDPDAEPDSPFEESVAYSIEKMGYDVILQVGCSGYRIDIGVVDPENPGAFLLGVECDGATYHSAYSTRDRDRLRQAVLEEMGWTIYRIWSTDWIYHRQNAEQALREAIENSRKGVKHPPKNNESEFDFPDSSPAKPSVIDPEGGIHIPGAKVYQPYEPSRIRQSNMFNAFHSTESRDLISDMMQKIIKHESPIHAELLCDRVLSAWGINRKGERIAQQLQNVQRYLKTNCSDEFEKKGKFWFCLSKKIIPRKCNIENQDTFREIDHIAPEEIAEAIILIVRTFFGVSHEHLIRNVALFFGMQRATEHVVNKIDAVFDDLLLRHVLLLRDEQVILDQGNNGTSVSPDIVL